MGMGPLLSKVWVNLIPIAYHPHIPASEDGDVSSPKTPIPQLLQFHQALTLSPALTLGLVISWLFLRITELETLKNFSPTPLLS